MRAGTADISVPASGAARQNRLVMAVAAVAALLDVISVNRSRQTAAAQQPDKPAAGSIAGAVGGTCWSESCGRSGSAGDEHAGMRFGQPPARSHAGLRRPSGGRQRRSRPAPLTPSKASQTVAAFRAWPAAFMQSISARTGQHQRAVGVTAGG